MNARQMCVANVQYKKPSAADAKRSHGLLRYLTYRDGRYEHIRQEVGLERWVDHGLGGSVRDIAARCDALKSDHVLAFTLVFNANPDLMAMVPLEQREVFVRELTETTLARFFEGRGIEGGIEYAYVLHHRATENLQAPGLHDPHTHVILPGTFFDEGAGERTALYFSRNKQVDHIDLLHRTTEQTLGALLDRAVGLDWEQRFDALEEARADQRRIADHPPHGVLIDDHGQTWNAWIGERRSDDAQTAVGYYRYFRPADQRASPSSRTDDLTLEFRPLVQGLSHPQAHTLASWLREFHQDHPEQSMPEGLDFLRDFDRLNDAERETHLATMTRQRDAAQQRQRALEAQRMRQDRQPSRRLDIDFF